MVKRLEEKVFAAIVENTPLISIDLIIKNSEGMVLLGQRQNRPAQNFWFVPGGRLYKDESFKKAFNRITLDELGCEISLDESSFLGIYEHFYNDNYFGNDFTTHYVVHGYEIHLRDRNFTLPTVQHHAYQWFNIETLLASTSVHQYTKNYFLSR